MVDKLIETIEPLGFPIFKQGSLGEDDPYPASFFTFWNNESDGDAFYDNQEHRVIWDFDLNFYSEDPSLIIPKLLEAKTLLKAAGFIVTGKGHDVYSDEATHTGRGIDVQIIDREV
jgi:hypothetical protein